MWIYPIHNHTCVRSVTSVKLGACTLEGRVISLQYGSIYFRFYFNTMWKKKDQRAAFFTHKIEELTFSHKTEEQPDPFNLGSGETARERALSYITHDVTINDKSGIMDSLCVVTGIIIILNKGDIHLSVHDQLSVNVCDPWHYLFLSQLHKFSLCLKLNCSDQKIM